MDWSPTRKAHITKAMSVPQRDANCLETPALWNTNGIEYFEQEHATGHSAMRGEILARADLVKG